MHCTNTMCHGCMHAWHALHLAPPTVPAVSTCYYNNNKEVSHSPSTCMHPLALLAPIRLGGLVLRIHPLHQVTWLPPLPWWMCHRWCWEGEGTRKSQIHGCSCNLHCHSTHPTHPPNSPHPPPHHTPTHTTHTTSYPIPTPWGHLPHACDPEIHVKIHVKRLENG